MMNLMERTRRAEDGFTLIEMLVTLLVVGILMSISLPTIRGHLARADLRAGARELVATLRNTRDKAVNEQVPRIVEFNETTQRFQIKKLVKTGATYAWQVDRAPEKLEDSVRFAANFPAISSLPPTGVAVPSDAAYFGTRGRYPTLGSLPAGPYTITLTSNGTSRTVTLSLYERTGEVTGV